MAASTLARACFGSFELTLLRKGCRLSAFCRRVDRRRFETSSRGPSEEGTAGGATVPVASTRAGFRPARSLGPACPLSRERMENRSEDMVGRWRLVVEGIESTFVDCDA